MYKLASIVVLGLLTVACVPHDRDEQVYETEQTVSEWQRVQEPVQQKQVVRQQPVQQVQPVVVQQARPVQIQTIEVQPPKQQWWATRPVAVKVAPRCPCTDPNDPCPQCYEK